MSRVIDSDSSCYFQGFDSSPIRKMTRLESTAPNDSTRTWLADFGCKWLESNQLQLVQNKFIKIIVIVLLGKNNESCEQWELRNFIRKYMHRIYFWRACMPIILSLKILSTYTNFDRLFSFLVILQSAISF
jgi:hypothetical protein